MIETALNEKEGKKLREREVKAKYFIKAIYNKKY
jgi:hypothetical protein